MFLLFILLKTAGSKTTDFERTPHADLGEEEQSFDHFIWPGDSL